MTPSTPHGRLARLRHMDAAALTVPIASLAALLGAALSAGISWGATKRRMDEQDRQISKLETAAANLDSHREQHALDLQSMKQDLGYTRNAVDRIESMLERLITRE